MSRIKNNKIIIGHYPIGNGKIAWNCIEKSDSTGIAHFYRKRVL